MKQEIFLQPSGALLFDKSAASKRVCIIESYFCAPQHTYAHIQTLCNTAYCLDLLFFAKKNKQL